ncbi:LEA type 2 family protein [Geobacter sp.]|uniref:LEA type 2 family protein n=1 Tax=Geobacter sp. TaxID=46610 RepID=UPI00262A8CE7|nr:LEA type 2 family protein [Geobacter sp.]
MKKMLLLLFSLVLAACSLFVSEPKVKVKDLAVVGLGAEGANLEFLLAVTNPNSFPLTLRGYTYDVRVMALPLTKGGLRERVEFPAGETTDVRLPFRVAYRDLWEILKRNPTPDAIPYRLDGGLEVETPVGTSTVPVTTSGNFTVPQRFRPSGLVRGLGDIVKGLAR